MSPSKMFHCIVDDTALITNISEIEPWVLRGAIALVVPLYTLERLHLLKKDASQIGQNARKAVKFLDEATSNPEAKVFIQEPDDQYPTWAQVEAHYIEQGAREDERKENNQINRSKSAQTSGQEKDVAHTQLAARDETEMSKGQLSQVFESKLHVSKDGGASPLSTPSLSPSSSAPQSTKTSPEVKSATIVVSDRSPVPPTLKALINPVVWYTQENNSTLSKKNVVFLTNSSDIAYLARDFGVMSKNIHQLRVAIGVEEQEAKNHDKYQKKHNTNTGSKPAPETRTLFRYEEEESEDEEVVFKPRGKGSGKTNHNSRSSNAGSVRNKAHSHSPTNSMNGLPPPPQTPARQIPVEEIDPDSFDRGSFARGSTPLAIVGNQSSNSPNNSNRGSTNRGNRNVSNSNRGGFHRGNARGVDRGAARGRGRLFVP